MGDDAGDAEGQAFFKVDLRFANAITLRDGLQTKIVARSTFQEAREAARLLLLGFRRVLDRRDRHVPSAPGPFLSFDAVSRRRPLTGWRSTAVGYFRWPSDCLAQGVHRQPAHPGASDSREVGRH